MRWNRAAKRHTIEQSTKKFTQKRERKGRACAAKAPPSPHLRSAAAPPASLSRYSAATGLKRTAAVFPTAQWQPQPHSDALQKRKAAKREEQGPGAAPSSHRLLRLCQATAAAVFMPAPQPRAQKIRITVLHTPMQLNKKFIRRHARQRRPKRQRQPQPGTAQIRSTPLGRPPAALLSTPRPRRRAQKIRNTVCHNPMPLAGAAQAKNVPKTAQRRAQAAGTRRSFPQK